MISLGQGGLTTPGSMIAQGTYWSTLAGIYSIITLTCSSRVLGNLHPGTILHNSSSASTSCSIAFCIEHPMVINGDASSPWQLSTGGPHCNSMWHPSNWQSLSNLVHNSSSSECATLTTNNINNNTRPNGWWQHLLPAPYLSPPVDLLAIQWEIQQSMLRLQSLFASLPPSPIATLSTSIAPISPMVIWT